MFVNLIHRIALIYMRNIIELRQIEEERYKKNKNLQNYC